MLVLTQLKMCLRHRNIMFNQVTAMFIIIEVIIISSRGLGLI
jgi:hypothetical protein